MKPQNLVTQVYQNQPTNGQNQRQNDSFKSKFSIPLPVVNNQVNDEKENYPNREMINSPREAAISQIVPWKEDHLLPPMKVPTGKKCLVLDLDETLVHSSFSPIECDFVIPIELEGRTYGVYVSKRPHVDEFMRICGKLYEVVVFTASLATYADAVLDLLDIHKVVDWRLFRESCSPVTGTYVKDLGRIGRPIEEIIIIDNSPHSYAFNPLNAIPVQSWFSDQSDTELLTLLPILERLAEPNVKDVKLELQLLLEVSGVDLINSAFSSFNLFVDNSENQIQNEEDQNGHSEYDENYEDGANSESHHMENSGNESDVSRSGDENNLLTQCGNSRAG